jgi:hypothetical protein
MHQHQSSRNLHLQYLAKNQSTQRCQSLITQGSNHPPVLEPHGPHQPPSQRNRRESLIIKRNHRFRLSREGTRASQKTTKSSPIQGDSWGKITSQGGTRSSYVTPNKNLARNHHQNSATKITTKIFENHQKGQRERQYKSLRNHAESSIHTMKVHTRSSLPPDDPSLFLDLT